MTRNTDLVQHFGLNLHGRDFVVGDIHGCFDALREALAAIGFTPDTDRLFSVGDLVDRGAQSEEAVEWLSLPWFHAVRGNHEQMAIGVAAGRHDLGNYLVNGGGWFLALPEETQQAVAAAFDTMPVCIEVETRAGLVGLVHADVGRDWSTFTAELQAPQSNNRLKQLMEQALWSRDRIRLQDDEPVAGVVLLYVGHTPVKLPTQLGNVRYVDTGCVFGKPLTVVEMTVGLA